MKWKSREIVKQRDREKPLSIWELGGVTVMGSRALEAAIDDRGKEEIECRKP